MLFRSIPHPADILEDLKKEFPDKTIEELVAMADVRVAAEIAKRKAAAEAAEASKPETIAEEPEN